MTTKTNTKAGMEEVIGRALDAIRATSLPGIYEEAVADLVGYARRRLRSANQFAGELRALAAHNADRCRPWIAEEAADREAWETIRGIADRLEAR